MSRSLPALLSLFSIDLFSLSPSSKFTFLSTSRFTSGFGILATYLLLSLTFLAFFNFGKNMFFKLNPKILSSEKISSDPGNFTLMRDRWFFALGLQNLKKGSQHFIDERIYQVEILQRLKIGTNITYSPIETEQCMLSQVPDIDDLKSYFSRNSIESLLCIKDYNKIAPEIKGTWDGPIYKNILINIKVCQNKSEIATCESEDKIREILNSANFAIYFTNLAIDGNDFEKPIRQYGRQIYFPISGNTLTYLEMLFGHLEFITDNGGIDTEFERVAAVNYLANRQIVTSNPNLVVQLDLKLDKIIRIYNRSYDKVQDVLAKIGGVFQAMFLLFKILVTPFVKFEFRKKLANNLLNFEIKEEDQRKTEEKEGRRKELPNLGLKPDSEVKSKEKCFVKRNKIEISKFQYFCKCCRSKELEEKKTLMDKGLRKVDCFLDLTYIFKKLLEIDKLKMVMFDKEQKNLFDLLPKPIVSLSTLSHKNNISNEWSFKRAKVPSEDKMKMLNESLEKIRGKREKSNFDERLVGMASGERDGGSICKQKFSREKKVISYV